MIEFVIPIQGLESGLHSFHFKVERPFFQHFEQTLVQDGKFEVSVELEKRSDMIITQFKVEGHLFTECDRCLEPIKLPIRNKSKLLFKYADEEREEEEIVFIPKGLPEINLSQYIYEAVTLALPLVKVYDCEDDEEAPCNDEMLDLLDSNTPKEDDPDDSIWDVLKGLKDN